MKIIQSFWTKPFVKNGHLKGGWRHRKYNYFSWALSCLQLRKYYDKVELITDAFGKSILIDNLKLPYTKVHVELDNINHFDISLWALGKIYAYSIQKEQFLHVDADVFISDKFNPLLMCKDLIAQNPEANAVGYRQILNEVFEKLPYIPSAFLRQKQRQENVIAVNAGILGGSNVLYFQEYTDQIFNFVNKNYNHIHKLSSLNWFNALYEQALFNVIAEESKIEIGYFFPNSVNNPVDIGHFHNPYNYVHAFGYNKLTKLVYVTLEERVNTLYPEYYYRIKSLMDSFEI